MRILILGGDGYLGWPTAMYLSAKGHTVGVVDNLAKRKWEAEIGCGPLWPIPPLHERVRSWNTKFSENDIKVWICDIAENRALLYKTMKEFKPDTIVHYAEQPSAPYSQMNANNCLYTQTNNIAGTLNVLMAVLHHDTNIHIVKLGTMGEYGTPNIDIEEGWLDVEHKGRSERVLYPKRPGSWYHLSKVHDSHNLEFACRTWGLRVTDLNQGIVYGTHTNETRRASALRTSFHYDAVFGTVLNRFITQSVAGEPLTVYGSGTQTRGFLDIRDTIRCVELACETPPDGGTFRVMNQFTEEYAVIDLANMVSDATGAEVQHISNPRVEAEDHYYNAAHTKLIDLGLSPHHLTERMIETMVLEVEQFKDNINSTAIYPTIEWRQ